MIRTRPLLWGMLLLAAGALAEGRPLTLAYNVFPPWKVVNDAGEPAGPYTEIVRELARRVKQPLAFLPCPIARCLAEVAEGRADLVIGIQNAPDRAAYLDFLEPPFAAPTRNALYLKAGTRAPLTRYEDLYGKRVAVTHGARYTPDFDSDPHIQRDVSPNIVGSFNKLAAGRVDVVIVNELHGEAVSTRPEFAGRVVRAPLELVAAEPRKVGLAKRSPYHALKPKLEAALASMVRDGTVNRLLARVED